MSNPEIGESSTLQGGLDPNHFGFKPKARDSHEIRTLPKGVKPAISAAVLAAIMTSSGIVACTSKESSAAPVEPTPTEQYNPTLVMETLPDPTDVGATFTPVPPPTLEPTEVIEKEVDFLGMMEGLEVVSREEVSSVYETIQGTTVFEIPVTEGKRSFVDSSRAVSMYEMGAGILLPGSEVVTMVDGQGVEIKMVIVEDILTSGDNKSILVLVVKDKEGELFTTEQEDSGALVTGVIPNFREYTPEQVETLSQSLEKFREYQEQMGAFRNGAKYPYSLVFGEGENEVISFLGEMMKRLNESDSTEPDFIAKFDEYVNSRLTLTEDGALIVTFLQEDTLLQSDLSDLSVGGFPPQESPSSKGMTLEEEEMVESLVNLSGMGVFLNDPKQKEQVLEFVKFRDALNGSNGSVEGLGKINTDNENMNNAMEFLANFVEQGGEWNSIALAYALRIAFPDLGVPKLGDKPQGTVVEVFRDNSDPRLSEGIPIMIDVMNLGYDFPQLAIIPTLYGGSIALGPPEDLYPKLDSGSIIFRKNIEIKENPEMDKLQVVLAKSVASDGSISYLIVELDEEGKMIVYTSQDNKDELIANKQWVIKDGYSGPNIFPSSPPGG
ncbi:hypothetical protein K8R14_03465 [bacterium]|nr:hypothetical protein [bacterium]